MIRHVRDAWRQARRRPLLTLVAVLTLAVGTGANTAFFSLLNALVLRPLPLPAPDRLFLVSGRDADGRQRWLTDEMVRAFAARQDSFSAISGYIGGGPVRVELGTDEFSAGIEVADVGYFSALGIQPQLGRFFEPGDVTAPAVVIGEHFWRTHLQADRSAIGASIRIEGMPFTVIGVAAAPFAGLQLESTADVVVLPSSYDVMLGVTAGETPFRGVIGRLRSGQTVDTAQAQIAAIWPSVLAATIPATLPTSQRQSFLAGRALVLPASTGFSFLRDRYADTLTLLVGLTALMLLVIGVNLAGALIAGAAAREQEFLVRVALGASRSQLVGQMMVESLLLVAAGTLAGLPIATSALPHLLSFLWPSDQPLPVSTAVDWRVLATSVGVLSILALTAGLAPAWLVARRSASGLTAHSRAIVRSASRGRAFCSSSKWR